MTPAPIPADEHQRIGALRELLILDTPPEDRFDRIVQFAAAEFEVPIALISLVDADRQWFKSRVGLDVSQTPRAVSFCGHAIGHGGLFVVEDARLDRRFADNPLVTGEPRVRFYAGAPLTLASGAAVGTLCLVDRRGRGFDAVDRAILEALRDLVVTELGRRAGAA